MYCNIATRKYSTKKNFAKSGVAFLENRHKKNRSCVFGGEVKRIANRCHKFFKGGLPIRLRFHLILHMSDLVFTPSEHNFLQKVTLWLSNE